MSIYMSIFLSTKKKKSRGPLTTSSILNSLTRILTEKKLAASCVQSSQILLNIKPGRLCKTLPPSLLLLYPLFSSPFQPPPLFYSPPRPLQGIINSYENES